MDNKILITAKQWLGDGYDAATRAEVKKMIDGDPKVLEDAFYKTLEEVKIKYDSNGFFKALYNQDEYALLIEKIIQNLSTLKI